MAWLLVTILPSIAAPPSPQGQRALEPFNYKGVSLEDGRFKAQLEEVRSYYLALSDDDLLKGFRTRAGLPAPGKDLGGWYSKDVFHVFGQIVSGLSRLYAATGDPALQRKANYLVAEWAKCIGPDGYFFASQTPFARHYIYDKTLWGLLDNCLYCGNRNATNHLSRVTDWAIKNLDRTRKPNDTAAEWYTLSENLYRAWLLTGDPKYRDFAQLWEYPDYWDFYARKADIFGLRPDGTSNDRYHAYSHVNTLGGAAMAWLVKGDPKYLTVVTNGFDYLQANQVFATGGFGPDEKLLPRDKLLTRLDWSQKSFETQCGSWAAFKLSKYLISFTGDARFGDWVERLAINGLGASIPMTADGRVYYYADYNVQGGSKKDIDIQWSCCTGTRPQAVADLQDLIYFKDAANLYVNLYTASSVRWPRDGQSVVLTQRTAFPEAEEVSLSLALPTPARFGLKLRVPGWLAAPMEVRLNGRKLRYKMDQHHWAVLDRRWQNGDTVTLRLPMKLWASSLTPSNRYPAAVLCGPTVLAFGGTNGASARLVDLDSPKRSLVPVAGKPLHYHLAEDPTVEARPFFSFAEAEPYFLYVSPQSGNRIPHWRFTYEGKWTTPGPHHVSNEPGASVEFEFEGTGLRWHGNRYDDAGRGEVTLDGKVYCVVDQYGPGRDLPFEWSCLGLSAGRHILRIKVLEEKTAPSLNRYLNLSSLEVVK